MQNILFLPGTINHFKQMCAVAANLKDMNCYFAPFFADGFMEFLRGTRIFNIIFNRTSISSANSKRIERLILENGYPLDMRGKKRNYDLVVVPTDIYLPDRIRRSRIVLIQEGGLYPDTIIFYLVKMRILPRFFANTAAFGISNEYDVLCAASEGYKKLFLRRGIDKEKILVTGTGGYDNFEKYRKSPRLISGLPKRYVLVCLSPSWENLGFEWDEVLIKAKEKSVQLGVPLVIKVHPREEEYRINKLKAEKFLVFQEPNAELFAASAVYAFLQSSSSIYSLIYFKVPIEATKLDVGRCRKLMPWQNGGTSSRNIAKVCRTIVNEALLR